MPFKIYESMKVTIKFLGGAKTVTGSKYLIELENNFRFLLECGMFQGLKELRLRNWDKLPVDAESINAVVVSHAHIDHTGYLPRLFKEGYQGQVHCTKATGDLMEVMLTDSARLQEEEAGYAKKKGYSKHAHPQPLYTEADARNVLPQIKRWRYKQRFSIHPNVEVVFQDAGHLLGSAIVEVFIKGDAQTKKIVFSGDIGRYEQEILNDPTTISEADVLLVESTYGNRENDVSNLDESLTKIINKTFESGGILLVPAFAVGRTQAFLYHVQQLIQQKLIPDVTVYIDSPMAISASNLYARHSECHKMDFDEADLAQMLETKDVVFCHTSEQSRFLNTLNKNAIVISASGMMTGGRILHHLFHRLPNPNDTLLIIGYQAEGTRGRKILDGEPTIRIFGEEVPVKCNVEYFSGMSGHADRSELIRWLKGFSSKPKFVFTIHGEAEVMQEFAENIKQEIGWEVTVPEYLESFVLFDGI